MLAALLTRRRVIDTHDPGWITTDERDGHLKKRHDKSRVRVEEQINRRRIHIEDAFNRLLAIPEAAEKVREVITVEEPDFRMLARNQEILRMLTRLYQEYLEDEDIIIIAASQL